MPASETSLDYLYSRAAWHVAAPAIALLLAGCAGGAHTPSPPGPAVSPAGARAPVAFHIMASRAVEALRRLPAYIPATAVSIELRVHQNGAIVVDVSEPLSSCISASNGCTVAVNAPVGASTWDAVTYDAQQNPLSANAGFPLSVVANATNSVNIVLGGLPQSLTMAFGASDAAAGSVEAGFTLQGAATAAGAGVTRTLTIAALDADGNTIVGAGAPAITAVSGDTAHVSLQPLQSGNPATFTLTTLAYTSAPMSLTATATPASQTNALPATQTVTMQFDRHFTTPRIYIDDPGAQTVRAFDESGTPISLSGTWTGLTDPIGIDYDPHDDQLYISNYDTGTLSTFDTEGNVVANYSGLMSATGPEEVAVVTGTQPPEIAVAHENARIYRFSESGTLLGSFAIGTWPAGLDYDAHANTLIEADFSDNHVRFVAPDGSSVVQTSVVVPAALRVAYDATTHNAYVARTNQITIVDETGNAVTPAGTFPGPASIYGLAFDTNNSTLYVIAQTGSVLRYDEQGNYLGTSGFSGLSSFVASAVVVP